MKTSTFAALIGVSLNFCAAYLADRDLLIGSIIFLATALICSAIEDTKK